MGSFVDTWARKAVTPDEAVARIANGMRVFLHGAAATPTPLIEALSRRVDLEGVLLYHLHTAGPAPFADPERASSFQSVSLFTGAPLRRAIEEGRADFVPIFLSDIPRLFSTRAIPLDVAIVQLTSGASSAASSRRSATSSSRNLRMEAICTRTVIPRPFSR
jgi:acyl-CoA hydrolase